MKLWGGTRAVALLAVVTMVCTATPAAAGGAATRGYVANRRDGSLLVLDPATNTVTDRIALGYQAAPGVTVRPDGREVYLTDHWGGRIQVLSTATNTVVATIPVGGLPGPGGLAFTPDSRRAYVSNTGTGSTNVTAIDTATRQIIRVIPTPDGGAHGTAVSPDGTRVYVGTERVINNFVVRELTVIATATNRVTTVIRLPDLIPASQIKFAPNGSLALVNSGVVIDARTDTLRRDIPLGFWMTDFEWAPDSTSVYVADMCAENWQGAVQLVDVASGAVTRTIFTGRNPRNISLTPDKSRLYTLLDGGRNFAELDIATGRVLDDFGVADPASRPLPGSIKLSGNAPPAPQPGQRFGLTAPFTLACQI
jgi:YVTN family beta-propeller protein